MNPFRRHWRKIVVAALAAPPTLLLLALVLLYVPPVQRWATGVATRQASKATGMEITVDKLRLGFPLSLYLKGVEVVKAPGDTLASVGELRLDVALRPLLKKRLEIYGLGIEEAYVSIADSVGLMLFRANIGELQTSAMHVDLKGEKADLGRWLLKRSEIYYSSTDTIVNAEKDPLAWQLTLDAIDIQELRVGIEMPYDSLFVSAQIGGGTLAEVTADLGMNRYAAERVLLNESMASYAQDDNPSQTPSVFDATHIALDDLHLDARKFVTHGSQLQANVSAASFKERSGLVVRSLKMDYKMDSSFIQANDVNLKTNNSHIQGDAYLEMALFSKSPTASTTANLKGHITPAEIYCLTGMSVDGLMGAGMQMIPTPLGIDIRAEGTLEELKIERFKLDWLPYLSMDVKGQASKLLEDNKRGASLTLKAQTGHRTQQLLERIAPTMTERFFVPPALRLAGSLSMRGEDYTAKLSAHEGAGVLQVDGRVNLRREIYQAQLDIADLNLEHFMPRDSIGVLTANVKADGRLFDLQKPDAESSVELNLESVEYKGKKIDSIYLEADLRNGNLFGLLDSRAAAVRVQAQIDGLINESGVATAIIVDVDTLDLQHLGFVEGPMATSFHLIGSAGSDLKQMHIVDLNFTDVLVTVGDQQIDPRELELTAQAKADSVALLVSAGDLELSLSVASGLDSLMATVANLNALLQREINRVVGLEQSSTDVSTLFANLPRARLDIKMARANPLADYLKYNHRVSIERFATYIRTQPSDGIVGLVDLQRIMQDTTRIDRVTLALGPGTNTRYFSDDYSPDFILDSLLPQMDAATKQHLDLMLRIDKEKYRGQEPFKIEVAARTSLQAAAIRGEYLNAKNERAVELGLRLWRDGSGYGLNFEPAPYPFVIAQNEVNVNSDNEIYFRKSDQTIRANLELTTPDGALLSINTSESEDDVDEIVLLVQRLNLEKFHAIPAASYFDGSVFADIRVQRQGGSDGLYMGTGDVSINNLKYDKEPIGTISASLFYEPRDKTSHYITGDISHDGNGALSVDGIYRSNSVEKPIEASLALTNFPLSIANPMIGRNMAQLFGKANGRLTVVGKTKNPEVNGSLDFDDAGAKLVQYATTLYADTKPLYIKGSTIHFDHFGLYSDVSRENPFALDGSFNLFGRRPMYADLRLTARDLILVNTKQPKDEELLYGRLAIGTDLTLRGSVSSMRIRGNLDVLGNTNITYIYADSPLKPKDNMAGVVEFTDFADTVFAKTRPEVLEQRSFGGMDINVGIRIDPAVRLGIDLTPDHSNYVQLAGGGELMFTYSPFGEISLTGRYEMSEGGKLRYSIPVVGAKLFDIDADSYIRWSGQLLDPYINLKAMQRVRADYSDDASKPSRKVNFNVGIVVKENLEKMKLSFDLSAPEEFDLDAQIRAMSEEERGKQAIGLMATGMYLGNTATGKFNFNEAFSSLVQKELNAVTGKLLEGTDLNIGIESGQGEAFIANPDITYSFSRRFFGDRVRVIIGGKVATGNTPTTGGQTFVDNVALEYRLDQAGSHYLSVFHHRITDNIFEGNISETGASYLIRRKLARVEDLFNFKRKVRKGTLPQSPEADSLKNNQLDALPPKEAPKAQEDGK